MKSTSNDTDVDMANTRPPTPTSMKKKRKARHVKNAYVEIDDVEIAAGDDFEDWIRITKQKLRTREQKIMSVRVKMLQNIINKQCKSFVQMHSNHHLKVTVRNYDKVITNDLIEKCLTKFHQVLDLWKGINVSKTKKPLSTFRQYFIVGKSWFDQKKKTILAPDFWIKFFCILQQFTKTAAALYFKNQYADSQDLYSHHLLFHILHGVFGGHLNFVATKPQPLIPCGILKDSNPMKQYLLHLHPSLNIQIFEERHSASTKRINAKKILDFVVNQLQTLSTNAQTQFHQKLVVINNININNNAQNNNNQLNGNIAQNNNNQYMNLPPTAPIPNIAQLPQDLLQSLRIGRFPHLQQPQRPYLSHVHPMEWTNNNNNGNNYHVTHAGHQNTMAHQRFNPLSGQNNVMNPYNLTSIYNPNINNLAMCGLNDNTPYNNNNGTFNNNNMHNMFNYNANMNTNTNTNTNMNTNTNTNTNMNTNNMDPNGNNNNSDNDNSNPQQRRPMLFMFLL